MHPKLVRHVVDPYFQWRMGRRVGEAMKALEHSQWFSPERLRDLQWERLRALVAHASRHVPYYRALFREMGAEPEDFRRPEDLARLPVLPKQVVRDRGRELIADGAVQLRRRVTSGSTGTPMITFIDARCWDWWLAAERRGRRWWGVDVGDRNVSLTSAPPSHESLLKGYLLLNDYRLHYSDLSDASLAAILRRLARFRPALICGFPTMLARLAHFVLDHPGSADRLSVRAVFCTGEVLYPDQRTAMARAFDCPVVNEYGSSENWLMASECPEGRMHIHAENVYLEYRPATPDRQGVSEIVVTDLRNWGMPFVRYAIGDLGRPLAERCPCGRGLPLLDLQGGRLADLAVLPDGRYVDDSVFGRIFEEAGHAKVRQFRVTQEAIDRFTVLIAADRDDGITDAVRDAYRRILGPGPSIEIRIVPEIPLEPSGKLRSFVSHLAHPAVRHRRETTTVPH